MTIGFSAAAAGWTKAPKKTRTTKRPNSDRFVITSPFPFSSHFGISGRGSQGNFCGSPSCGAPTACLSPAEGILQPEEKHAFRHGVDTDVVSKKAQGADIAVLLVRDILDGEEARELIVPVANRGVERGVAGQLLVRVCLVAYGIPVSRIDRDKVGGPVAVCIRQLRSSLVVRHEWYAIAVEDPPVKGCFRVGIGQVKVEAFDEVDVEPRLEALPLGLIIVLVGKGKGIEIDLVSGSIAIEGHCTADSVPWVPTES